MRAYYTIFDVVKYQVGLAGKFIDMGPPIIPQNSTVIFSKGEEVQDIWNSTVMWIAVATAATVALMITGAGIYYFMIKKEDLTKIMPTPQNLPPSQFDTANTPT